MTCTGAIVWTAFSWEAFATLVTGLAAVAAAWAVARKQGQIVERQVALQELTFRHEVFEKRAVIYNAIRRYIGEIVYSGKPSHPSFDMFKEYFNAVETVRFLFSKRLHLEMKALDHFVSEMRKRDFNGDADMTLDEVDYYSKRLSIDLMELRRRYDALPAMFEQEMSITANVHSLTDYVTGRNDEDAPDEIGRVTAEAARLTDNNAVDWPKTV